MTIPKRDWRVRNPAKVPDKKKKFNMLEGVDETKRKSPKTLKPHLLPSQFLKD